MTDPSTPPALGTLQTMSEEALSRRRSILKYQPLDNVSVGADRVAELLAELDAQRLLVAQQDETIREAREAKRLIHTDGDRRSFEIPDERTLPEAVSDLFNLFHSADDEITALRADLARLTEERDRLKAEKS